MKAKQLILNGVLLFACYTGLKAQDGVGGGNPPIFDDPDPCCLGNYCNMPIKPLFWDRQLELDRFNFNFTGDKDYTTKVNIGYNCGIFPLGKFNVNTNALTTNISGQNQSIGISALAEHNADWLTLIGTRTEAKTTARNTMPYGLYATSIGPGNAWGVWSEIVGGGRADGVQVGGRFMVIKDSSWRNIGVEGYAVGKNFTLPNPSNRFNIGVTGFASDNIFPFASFMNQLFYPQSNIGIHGSAGNLFNYTTPSNYYAGWFDGDVMVNGTGYNTSFAVFTSDRRFKDKIENISNASNIIAKLNPTTYFMKTNNEYGLHFSATRQYGFISQEVEAILPELVTEIHKPASVDKDGKEVTQAVDFKGLNYMGFIAILTKGIQEQQDQMVKQQQQIDELKAQISLLLNNSNKGKVGTTVVPVNLTDKNIVVLDQNVPNPFAESTVISYNVPENFTKAQIQFTNQEGKIIKAVDILSAGPGSMSIFANDLSNGVYTYSLVVDGNVIATKKMIKE
jgi:hypothetical protein